VTEPLWEDGDRPRVAAMGPVKVRVPAKINLHLGVGTPRIDGFHELATIYQAIALFDELTARPADTLALTMDGEGAGQLALDDTNLIIRAVRDRPEEPLFIYYCPVRPDLYHITRQERSRGNVY